MRLVVSGGGTGGHIFPAIAVAEEFKRRLPDSEVLFIGSRDGMEADIVPAAGIPFQGVTARKLRKVLSPDTALVALSLGRGCLEARRFLRAFKADVILGTGGYVAAAAVIAGSSMRIRSAILAPDMVPGRTNLLLSRFVDRICITFDKSESYFPTAKTVVTGMPLRMGVSLPLEVTAMEARRRFTGLRPDAFTLLVLGGSQGARAINQVVCDAAPALVGTGVQILHQTGARNYDEIRAAHADLVTTGGYCPIPFLRADEMAAALRAADLVVCRGGISTLAEVTYNRLPAIVVPLPTAYADHQTFNAQALESSGACILKRQGDLNAEVLTRDISELRANPPKLRELAAAAAKSSRPSAARDVCTILDQLANRV